MKELCLKYYNNLAVRYIVVGGMTTFVNLAMFSLLRYVFGVEFTISNFIGIVSAIVFAFFANKVVVFRSHNYTLLAWIKEGVTFIGARLFTLLIEVIVPVIMIGQLGIHDFVAKLLIQAVILVLNFVFSKFFVFKENKEEMTTKEWYQKNFAYVWIFGISTFVMTVVWIFNQIGPFGNHTMLCVDGIHQYTPFFSEYYEKLKNGGSLMYTWNVGMGGNFLSLFSYYLSSPFNLLVLLFEKKYLSAVISFALTSKIILSGLSMAYYLKNKKGEHANDIIIIVLSLAYSFSTYMVGYNWCTMWVDTIMILPLILLGFERLMEEKDYRLYVLTLFYGLFCNYYIGFMVCLFLVCWFFMYQHKNIKNLFFNGIRFAIGSLLGGGTAAILLMPAFYGIMNTASANSFTLPESEAYGSYVDVFQKLLVGVETVRNQTFDGGINLYCGIIVLFGAVLFLVQGKISLWKRIRYVLMLAFLFVSANNEMLNYVWHAFHDQYGIPNRFSFLIILLLIIMAEQAFAYMEKDAKKSLFHLKVVPVALMVFVVALNLLGENKVPMYCYIVSIVLVYVYCLFFVFMLWKKVKKSKCYLIVTIIGIVEIMATAIYGYAKVGSVDTNHYLADTENVSELKEYMTDDGEGFYRADMLKSLMLDEATWHNLPSIGIFGSTVPGHMVKTMNRLGFYTGANEYLYHGSTPLTNAMLSVKYAFVRDSAYNNLTFEYVAEKEDIKLLKNPFYLPIGYVVEEDVKDINMGSSDVFYMHNQLVRKAAGVNRDLFTEFDFDCDVVSDDAATTYDISDHRITYRKESGDTATISATMIVPFDMELYVNCKGSRIKNLTLYMDGIEITQDRYQNQLFHVGYVAAGQEITIEYFLNSGSSSGTLDFRAAAWNIDVFEEAYANLSDTVLENITYEDGYINGTVTCEEDSVLFTSIPYDKGWKAYVDGEEAEITVLCDSFIGLELEKSTHEIEFKYTTVGLNYGIIISVASWGIFLSLCYMYGRRRKREAEIVEEENQEGDYSGSGAGDQISSGDESNSEGDASDSGYSDDSVYYSGSSE